MSIDAFFERSQYHSWIVSFLSSNSNQVCQDLLFENADKDVALQDNKGVAQIDTG